MLDYIARQPSLPPAERTASSASCESDSTRVVTSKDRTDKGCNCKARQVKRREAPPSSILVLLPTSYLLNQPFFRIPSKI